MPLLLPTKRDVSCRLPDSRIKPYSRVERSVLVAVENLRLRGRPRSAGLMPGVPNSEEIGGESTASIDCLELSGAASGEKDMLVFRLTRAPLPLAAQLPASQPKHEVDLPCASGSRKPAVQCLWGSSVVVGSLHLSRTKECPAKPRSHRLQEQPFHHGHA